VTIEIYDPAGRSVARLVDAVQEKGSHEATWNGKNGAGAAVGSGVYFCRLTAGKETLTKKMVLLK
jgi:flagellar hook assembly protein FlgD